MAVSVTGSMIGSKTASPTASSSEFSELYRLEHEQHFTPERTAHEVEVLIRARELQPHEHILDLGCGWGRHLAELRRRGFTRLVGIDVQEAFLDPLEGVTLLAKDAAALGSDPDFRATTAGSFDAVYCAFSGLLSTPEAAPRVLAGVALALKPGGRFWFDTQNRERLAAEVGPVRSWRGGGELPWLLEERRFDLGTGLQELEQTRIFPDGHAETQTLTRYHYTLAELTELCRAAGLSVAQVYGDWQLSPYTAQSPRTILVAYKAATQNPIV